MKTSKWFRRLLVIGSVPLVALACLVPTAEATASGISSFGPRVTYNGVGVSMGTYAVTIYGSGTNVANVRGLPHLNTPIGNLCNWSMTAEFFDTSNHWYKTVTSRTFGGCFKMPPGGSQPVSAYLPINQNVKRGYMCSTLKQNGIRQTSVCHNIA